MSDNVIVQFVGFEVKALVREYNFHVRQASSEIREFALTIVNEAFNSRRVRYQDAPRSALKGSNVSWLLIQTVSASTLPYQRDRSGRVPQRPRTKGFGKHL